MEVAEYLTRQISGLKRLKTDRVNFYPSPASSYSLSFFVRKVHQTQSQQMPRMGKPENENFVSYCNQNIIKQVDDQSLPKHASN
jgi:hypothetical protein